MNKLSNLEEFLPYVKKNNLLHNKLSILVKSENQSGITLDTIKHYCFSVVQTEDYINCNVVGYVQKIFNFARGMPMSVEKNSVQDQNETKAIMDFLEQYFSLSENSDQREGKEYRVENFTYWLSTAKPSVIASKLNEQNDLSKAKDTFQRTIDEIDKMIQHPGSQNISEKHPHFFHKLIWAKSYIEAQKLLSENPSNEDVLGWLGQRGWLKPSTSLLSSHPETGWGDGFHHLSPFHLAQEVNRTILRKGDGENRPLLSPSKERALENKMNRNSKKQFDEILTKMRDDGLHQQEPEKLKQLLGDFLPDERWRFEVPWKKFPLTPKHLDLHPEFQFQRFMNGEEMVNHHRQRSLDLENFCGDLKKRFQTFPFSWSSQDFSMLRSMYSQCRIVAASRERGDDMNEWLSEVIAEYQQAPADSVSPREGGRSSHVFESINQTELNNLASTLNYVLLVLGQLCLQKEISSLSAIHFSTSLERFHLTKSRMHFLQLLDSFEILTKHRNRGSFLDDTPTNGLHPCYEFDDPVFGTHLFMNMAVMDMVRQNPSILGEKRMEPFLKSGTMYLNKDLFEDKVPCSHGTRSIHRHDSAASKYWDLQNHYRSLLEKSSESMSGSSVSVTKNEKEQGDNLQPENEVLVLYDMFPEFEDVEYHQYVFRHNILDKFQPRAEREKRNKQSERDFLSSYGDMAAPNPLRAFDSDKNGQIPQNALEAIERVSTNLKNQGLRTQNRLVCFLDMVWANLHRRESFGNRFVGLDLLEEIESISSTMPETRVAELLLFHQQKILRLYDKPGKEDLSRTNKLSRNNLYARILHQFRRFLEEPSESIDHLARPPMKSPLRRLLHPIRLQTGRDLPIDEVPFEVVVSIVLSRMSALIDSFEEVFQLYMSRLTDLSTIDRPDSPSHVHGAMFRSLATMLGLEICQIHMMVQYLGRGTKWKKSHMYYNQTKLAVEGNGFDAIKDDFAPDIRFDVDAYGDGTESIGDILRGQGVPMPLELLQRLNHYCYSTWGRGDETRKALTQDELKLVASMNLFLDKDEPTGTDYVQLVRDFDRLYVNHGPRFMSPGRFAFNSFEYF